MKLFLNINPKLIAESAIPSTQTTIDEIANNIDTNIGSEVKIPKDVLDSFKIKDNLNPELWINDKLDPKIKANLIKIAKDFFKDLELPKEIKIKDIIFTGSLANYNWSKFSDIDLHIVIDLNQFDADPQMVEDYFFAQKSIWNEEHNIVVKNFPVEVYVQDLNAKLRATAVYSVLFDKWVLKPERENFKIDKKAIKDKAEQFIHYLRDVRQLYNDKSYQAAGDLSKKLKDKIRHMRNAGLERGGEFSLENLVFKVLRRTSFMDQLDAFKAKSYDNLMSIDESDEILDEGNDRYSSKRDYFVALFKATKAKKLYGNDPYFQNIEAGQFVGVAIVGITGKVSISTHLAPAADVRKNDLGLSETSHYITFKVMAGRGIEHPDTYSPNKQPAITRGGIEGQELKFTSKLPNGEELENGETMVNFSLPKPGSPASDAQIKTWLVYGDIIADFVKRNTRFASGYKNAAAADISKEKMAANPALERHKKKKDLEMELGRRITDSEFETFLSTGLKPEPKQKERSLYNDPEDEARRELQRQAAADRIAKAKARLKR